jgi:hypothetical protein
MNEKKQYNIFDIVPVLNNLNVKLRDTKSKDFIDGLSFATAMVSIGIKNSLHYNQHLHNKKLNEDLEELSYQYVQLKKELELVYEADNDATAAKPTIARKQRKFVYDTLYSNNTAEQKIDILKNRLSHWKR